MNLNNPALEIINRQVPLSKGLVKGIGVAAFVVLTFLGAYVRIPLAFTPVPVTLQTFFVLLSGAMLGRKLGALSQTAYIILGSMGLNIFAAAGGGIFYLLGPTGGYLIGFVIAAYTVGWIIGKRNEPALIWIILAMTAGSLIIYLLGAAWLALIIRLGFSKAFILGVLPFVAGDSLKLITAAMIFYRFRAKLTGVFS
ncbi:MAG: biotin transporter BioY [Candidatus Omnitrophota bacterium]|nr:biotin transporter BioY [Candidatus Omnitrophota bacterium]